MRSLSLLAGVGDQHRAMTTDKCSYRMSSVDMDIHTYAGCRKSSNEAVKSTVGTSSVAVYTSAFIRSQLQAVFQLPRLVVSGRV